jgi:sugar/nucleoside kinase (ribokinase family)
VLTIVDAGGERTFLTSRGAEATLTAADLGRVKPAARDAVYLSGYSLVHDSNRAALFGWLARLGGQPVFFDPGPLVTSIPAGALAGVLGRADWLTCNAREAAVLAGNEDPRAAAAALAGWAGRPGPELPRREQPRPLRVVVRTGPGGCLIGGPGAGVVHVPGFPVDVVDTNGAGDTHTGVFIAALAAGADEIEAARSANAAAALSVTRRGPATAPTRAELARFLARA